MCHGASEGVNKPCMPLVPFEPSKRRARTRRPLFSCVSQQRRPYWVDIADSMDRFPISRTGSGEGRPGLERASDPCQIALTIPDFPRHRQTSRTSQRRSLTADDPPRLAPTRVCKPDVTGVMHSSAAVRQTSLRDARLRVHTASTRLGVHP